AARASPTPPGPARRTWNPHRSTRPAPAPPLCWPLESTRTSASPRQIAPNSPRLPASPVSLLRTIPAMTDSLPLLDARRRKWAARPDDGTHRPGVSGWSQRYAARPRVRGDERADRRGGGHRDGIGDGDHQPGGRDHPPVSDAAGAG